MKKRIYKRKRFWGIIIVISFFLWLTLLNYIKFNDNKYIWEVTQISETSITLIDRKTGEKTLIIWDTTQIINRKDNSDIINTWDHVMILWTKIQEELRARLIRVVDERPITLEKK